MRARLSFHNRNHVAVQVSQVTPSGNGGAVDWPGRVYPAEACGLKDRGYGSTKYRVLGSGFPFSIDAARPAKPGLRWH